MGAPFLNFDPTAGEAPPQAPAPVETAADVVPAQSAQDVLRVGAFGDTGAEQYARLVAAGQPPAAPLVSGVTPGLAGMVGGGARAPMARPNANPVDPIANALMALGGGDPTKMDLQNQQLAASQQSQQIQLDKEFRDNASEFYTQLVPGVFKQFPGRPDLAAGFLMRAATSRGLTVDPAVLISLNQQMTDGSLPTGTLNRIITDPSTPSAVVVRLGASAKGANEAISAVAAADKASAEARTAPTKAALGLYEQAEKLSNPPTPSQVQAADAAGMSYQEQSVPGVPGAKMWVRVPNSNANTLGTIDPSKMAGGRNPREQQYMKAAREKLEAEVKAGKRPSFGEADIAHEIDMLRAQSKSAETEATKTASKLTESRNSLSFGLGQVAGMKDAVAKLGLADTAGDAWLQPLSFIKRSVARDPAYEVIKAFPAVMANVSRSLGGEKGVLTDPDIARINAAFGVGWFDTKNTYSARINFVEEVMKRAQASMEDAAKRPWDIPKKVSATDITYGEGDTLAAPGARIPVPGETPPPVAEAAGATGVSLPPGFSVSFD